MSIRLSLKWDIRIFAFILISSTFIIPSCSKTEEILTYGVYPVKKGNVSLEIDHETKGFTLNLRYFETTDGDKWLLHLNEINNTIGFYDLGSGQKVRSARYERQGPNGVGNVDGFDIISLDSILLLDRYQEKLSLARLNNSDTLEAYEFYKLKYPNAQTISTPYSSVKAPIAVLNKKAHLATIPFVDKSKTTLHNSSSNFLRLDLLNQTFEHQNLYTSSYKKKWPDLYNYISYDVNKKEELLVFSLPIEDSIFTIDKYGTKKSYFAKSKSTKQIREFSGDLSNQKEMREFYLLNDSYGAVLYDKYRRFYYRFTEKVAKEMLNRHGTDIYVRKFGLIIMNEKFEIIGEVDHLFTGSFPSIFVGEKGIYNMLASSDESKMFFELFTFE